LRASVPVVAGIFHMPYWGFQVANFTSAFLSADVLLTVGDVASAGGSSSACRQSFC
jgi:membrane protein DedA with SNARE-associated domain